MVRVFTNGPGDLGSIPGCVIPKTLKMVLDTSLLILSNIRYVSRLKWSNPGKGVVPSPTSQCSSYWKGSLPVVLDYVCQLYFTIYIYIYIYTYIYIWQRMVGLVLVLVLWHINHCSLFNVKSCFYIYTKHTICKHIFTLNGSKYCYISLTYQLISVKWSNSSISNNSI